MKFLIVSDTKLKVTLSAEDCLKYSIDTSGNDFSTNEVRLAIKNILSVAKDECGFCTEGDKILAQLYPMPDGSCELFITRLSALKGKSVEAVRDIEGLPTMENKYGAYCFRDAKSLISAARAIYREGIDCDLYLADDGVYYISIREDFLDGISEFEILTEYGERLPALPLYVISEYGTLLCKSKAIDYILAKSKL